jgi:hypothetical protein
MTDLWKAIDWKGEVNTGFDEALRSDSTFAEHFSRLLNPSNLTEEIVDNYVYLPM